MSDPYDNTETRHRYGMARAAALLEEVEAACDNRKPQGIWQQASRLGATPTNEAARQFQTLVFSAAKTLPARRYEDYLAALHDVHGGFDVYVTGTHAPEYNGMLLSSVPKYNGYPDADTRRETATRFVAFAMQLYSEFLAVPESETKFPAYKSTQAYQTWKRNKEVANG